MGMQHQYDPYEGMAGGGGADGADGLTDDYDNEKVLVSSNNISNCTTYSEFVFLIASVDSDINLTFIFPNVFSKSESSLVISIMIPKQITASTS